MKVDHSVSGSPCPSELEWGKVAAGMILGPEADRLLVHAAECRACSMTLRDMVCLLQDVDPTAAPEKVGAWDEDKVRELARRMADKLGPIHRKDESEGVFAVLARWIAAQASLPGRRLAVAGGMVIAAVVFIIGLPTSPPLDSLATAYSARRNVELRIHGATYSPIRVARSSSPTDVPPELPESEARIARHLERKPVDGEWLHARGRAELLRWNFDPAIRTFEAAADAKADSPEFWIDFATAYFERAEARGAAADYARAVDLLDRALQRRPADPVALFNRGVVNSKLSRTADAVRDFELCLKGETEIGWREEAQRLLDEARRRVRGSP